MTFLQAVVLGAALGFLFDIFRIIRIALPAARPVVAVQDIIFFVICALVTFFFLLGGADGKVRFFLIIGECLGALLYLCSLSLILMGFSRLIIGFVHKLFSVLLRFIIAPFLRLLGKIVAILLWPPRFLLNILKKVCQRAKYSLKRMRILLYNHIITLLKVARAKATAKNRSPGERYLHEAEDQY